VLGISRLVPRKGFDVLIDAVARLARHSFPDSGSGALSSPPGGAGGVASSLPGGAGGAASSPPGGAGGLASSLPGGAGGVASPLPAGAGGVASSLPTGQSGGPVHLALAGGGRDRERLARRAARAGLGDRFHLLGRVADEDLAAVYACADVFAMCCRERWRGLEAEGFGIVFLEAAASGVPAVAGRSGGAWEAVEDGTTGYVVDPLDAGAVAAALRCLLADPALRRSMGAAARARAEQGFAYDSLAGRLTPLACGDLSVFAPIGAGGPAAPREPPGPVRVAPLGPAPAPDRPPPLGPTQASDRAAPLGPTPAPDRPPPTP
jgi:glycosyltransferase involved in cell wall biosynthesis